LVFEDGKRGVIAGHRPQELAEGSEKIMLYPRMARALATEAGHFAYQYLGIERMANSYAQLITEVTA
jgi:hypothetical protein